MRKPLSGLALGSLLLVTGAAHAQDAESHTERFSIVAKMLASGSANRVASDDVRIDNHEDKGRATLEDFFAYAGECKLEEIYSVPQTPDLPIMVQWDCQNILEPGAPVENIKRRAGFSFRDGMISRITFGNAGAVKLSFDQRD